MPDILLARVNVWASNGNWEAELAVWIVAVVALVVLTVILRAISAGVWESALISRQLHEELKQLSSSVSALTAVVFNLTEEMGDRLTAVRRLLQPTAYLAESQVETMEAEKLAQVSRKVDRLAEVVERAKSEQLRQEIQEIQDDQQWKQQDAEMQAKVRQEKRLTRIRLEREQREADRPPRS